MSNKTEQFERRKKVLYDLICDKQYIPMKLKEMAILLQVSKEDRNELKEILDALILDGKVELTSKGKYQKAKRKMIQGTFIAHQRGFGFVEVEGWEEDLFIPEDQTMGALHKDRVQVAILNQTSGKRKEGTIVKILERGISQVIGTYQKSRTYGFVIPDNARITTDIFIPQEHSKNAEDGSKVLVDLVNYGDEKHKPEGKVREVIGHIDDPGTDNVSVIYEYELPLDFPEKVLNQAEKISESVIPADLEGRTDLRNVMMVTIDGEDAKDLDDAVSLEFDGEIYHLGVHIADVANYVQENSALDREARTRGTSVYLTDRVIPMLPKRLSNGICSLNAEADRLSMSCLMEIDQKGNVLSHEIVESVICVNRRMSYNEVQSFFDGTAGTLEHECKDLVPMFFKMKELAAILHAKRRKRGSIDFDLPESKVILDETGKSVEIRSYEQNEAMNLIEEFMLLANETIAEHFFWQEMPFVFRTHETPDPDKIKSLISFISHFGYGMKGISDEVHPKELQKLLGRIADTPEEAMITRLTLRSMKQARYTTEDTGHFGLAAKHYCHFTSPIRRYPDLQIHRIIKDVIRGRMNEKKIQHYQSILSEVAENCCITERRAAEAERESVKLKKAEYMLEHIGEEYEAVISGLTSYGMYAELDNTVEGLIHVNRMYDDRYYFKEDTMEMYGMDLGRVFRLGDRIRVRVVDADKITKTVDFELISEYDSHY